ncbi:MAG: methyltransferase, TIGR04325 family [Coriobacteriales bacterium]|nr:methyltransferase, TIGR04325 family [Coriobacteriales bacterium]
MNSRNLITQLTPPAVLSGYRKLRRRMRGEKDASFTGDFASWDDARAASTGYDADAILERTRAALAEVRDGRAAYERDSVLFDEIEYSWPLAAGLLRAAALEGGRLDVLDFGGSLGSTYFQNRALLRGLPSVRWNIVEQPKHVAVGKAEFESDELRFFGSIEECLAESDPNVVVLGSVLQYLEDPRDKMLEIARLPVGHVVIDRTPFWEGERDRLVVQQVASYIYDATYPCWLLSRSRFERTIAEAGFARLAEFPAIDVIAGPVPISYRGMLLDRKRGGALASATDTGTGGTP